MLIKEINAAQRLVRTDAYQMSLGEIVSMYEAEEIIIHPEFQRLFRWNISQKSKLIESLLLGIPLPSIFVFEKDNGSWELIDGLQRLSTILEFMGVLKSPEGTLRPPSVLEGTKYLPSLHNVVWDTPPTVEEVDTVEATDLEEGAEEEEGLEEVIPLDKANQLAIRRSRISVEILKRPSDNQTKFDLFQRLNSGGTQANAQELRNCIMLMVNEGGFREIRNAAEGANFLAVTGISEDQMEKQRHLEFATRFLVHTNVPYDGILDVEEYIDDGIVTLIKSQGLKKAVKVMTETFNLLFDVAGNDALRRFEGNRHVGKVGLVGLEGIAVGVAKNLTAIKKTSNPVDLLRKKTRAFWTQPKTNSFTSPGLRGTTRLQRTLPFGSNWFKP